jgi:AAT family amino acid transporter
LFYGAGVALKLAGPAVILDYILGGIIVAIVMRSLGEMTVEEPLAGSFSRFAEKAFGGMMGFITGGMWWFFWVATVMSELAAIGLLVQYWFPLFPAWVPGFVALALFVISNLLTVEVFGELEFWFAILKILAIAAFMVLGALLTVLSIGKGADHAGISNLWTHGGFFPRGISGALEAVSLVVLGYSGVETLAVTAGETGNPLKAIPKAVSNVTWRIAILYVGSIAVMLVAFPWTALVGRSMSPYVLLFARTGIPIAATVVNIIIITSGLSSSNTGLYGGSRMLFSLANDNHLPKGLAHLSKHKVPDRAVVVTGLAMSLGVLITYLAPNSVYVWISSAAAFAAIWTWTTILVTELTLRKRHGSQGLKYPMGMWPLLPILGVILLVGMLLAIMTSPLTDVSVWSGIAWLAFLFVWWFIRKWRVGQNSQKS